MVSASVMSVTVPGGVSSGQLLAMVTPSGLLVIVPCPSGAKPKTTFNVDLGAIPVVAIPALVRDPSTQVAEAKPVAEEEKKPDSADEGTLAQQMKPIMNELISTASRLVEELVEKRTNDKQARQEAYLKSRHEEGQRLRRLKNKAAQARAALEEQQNELENVRKHNNEIAERISSLYKNAEDLLKQLMELKNELVKIREANEVADKVVEASQDRENLAEKLAKLERELLELRETRKNNTKGALSKDMFGASNGFLKEPESPKGGSSEGKRKRNKGTQGEDGRGDAAKSERSQQVKLSSQTTSKRLQVTREVVIEPKKNESKSKKTNSMDDGAQEDTSQTSKTLALKKVDTESADKGQFDVDEAGVGDPIEELPQEQDATQANDRKKLKKAKTTRIQGDGNSREGKRKQSNVRENRISLKVPKPEELQDLEEPILNEGSLEETLTAAERLHRVLQMRRETKMKGLKRGLEKTGQNDLLKTVINMMKAQPETASAREKKMVDKSRELTERLDNLKKVVDFWDRRITKKEEAKKVEMEIQAEPEEEVVLELSGKYLGGGFKQRPGRRVAIDHQEQVNVMEFLATTRPGGPIPFGGLGNIGPQPVKPKAQVHKAFQDAAEGLNTASATLPPWMGHRNSRSGAIAAGAVGFGEPIELGVVAVKQKDGTVVRRMSRIPARDSMEEYGYPADFLANGRPPPGWENKARKLRTGRPIQSQRGNMLSVSSVGSSPFIGDSTQSVIELFRQRSIAKIRRSMRQPKLGTAELGLNAYQNLTQQQRNVNAYLNRNRRRQQKHPKRRKSKVGIQTLNFADQLPQNPQFPGQLPGNRELKLQSMRRQKKRDDHYGQQLLVLNKKLRKRRRRREERKHREIDSDNAVKDRDVRSDVGLLGEFMRHTERVVAAPALKGYGRTNYSHSYRKPKAGVRIMEDAPKVEESPSASAKVNFGVGPALQHSRDPSPETPVILVRHADVDSEKKTSGSDDEMSPSEQGGELLREVLKTAAESAGWHAGSGDDQSRANRLKLPWAPEAASASGDPTPRSPRDRSNSPTLVLPASPRSPGHLTGQAIKSKRGNEATENLDANRGLQKFLLSLPQSEMADGKDKSPETSQRMVSRKAAASKAMNSAVCNLSINSSEDIRSPQRRLTAETNSRSPSRQPSKDRTDESPSSCSSRRASKEMINDKSSKTISRPASERGFHSRPQSSTSRPTSSKPFTSRPASTASRHGRGSKPRSGAGDGDETDNDEPQVLQMEDPNWLDAPLREAPTPYIAPLGCDEPEESNHELWNMEVEKQQVLHLVGTWRDRVLLRHNGFQQAYDWMASNNSSSQGLTRGQFEQAMATLGFSAIDANRIFSFVDTQNEGSLSRHDFVHVLRSAAPMRSLVQLKARLLQKFGSSAQAFEAADCNGNQRLDAAEFRDLLAEMGVTAEDARHLFAQVQENNEEEVGPDEDLPWITSNAFLLSMRHAEGLAVIHELRSHMHGQEIFNSFRKLDPVLFTVPVTWPDFQRALGPLNIGASHAKKLFKLGEPHSDGERVVVQDIFLRILAGLGHHYLTLKKALASGWGLDALQKILNTPRGSLSGGQLQLAHGDHNHDIVKRVSQTYDGSQRRSSITNVNFGLGAMPLEGAEPEDLSADADCIENFHDPSLQGPWSVARCELQWGLLLLQQWRHAISSRHGGVAKAFRAADANWDDHLEPDEFVNAMQQWFEIGANQSMAMFRATDRDHNGSLSQAEFMDALRRSEPLKALPQLKKRFLQVYPAFQVAYDSMDPERRGFVGIAEWKQGLEDLYIYAGDAKRMFELIDTDGDGHITRDEFVAALQGGAVSGGIERQMKFERLHRQLAKRAAAINKEVFAKQDLDHRLGHLEFVQAMQAAGVTEREANDLFNFADGDNDSMVTLRECQALLNESMSAEHSAGSAAPGPPAKGGGGLRARKNSIHIVTGKGQLAVEGHHEIKSPSSPGPSPAFPSSPRSIGGNRRNTTVSFDENSGDSSDDLNSPGSQRKAPRGRKLVASLTRSAQRQRISRVAPALETLGEGHENETEKDLVQFSPSPRRSGISKELASPKDLKVADKFTSDPNLPAWKAVNGTPEAKGLMLLQSTFARLRDSDEPESAASDENSMLQAVQGPNWPAEINTPLSSMEFEQVVGKGAAVPAEEAAAMYHVLKGLKGVYTVCLRTWAEAMHTAGTINNFEDFWCRSLAPNLGAGEDIGVLIQSNAEGGIGVAEFWKGVWALGVSPECAQRMYKALCEAVSENTHAFSTKEELVQAAVAARSSKAFGDVVEWLTDIGGEQGLRGATTILGDAQGLDTPLTAAVLVESMEAHLGLVLAPRVAELVLKAPGLGSAPTFGSFIQLVEKADMELSKKQESDKDDKDSKDSPGRHSKVGLEPNERRSMKMGELQIELKPGNPVKKSIAHSASQQRLLQRQRSQLSQGANQSSPSLWGKLRQRLHSDEKGLDLQVNSQAAPPTQGTQEVADDWGGLDEPIDLADIDVGGLTPRRRLSTNELGLDSAEIAAGVAEQWRLVLARVSAFGGSFVEMQIAVHKLQDLRQRLLTKYRNFGAAFNHLDAGKDGELDSQDFQATVVKVGNLAGCTVLDAERMFRVVQAAEAKPQLNLGDFAVAMRFIAPVKTYLDLRKSMVQHHRTVAAAFSLLRRDVAGTSSHNGTGYADEVSIDVFERRMLCVLGIVDHDARRLFRLLDVGGGSVGHILWSDLEFALDHAGTFQHLEGLRQRLLRVGSRPSEVVLGALKGMTADQELSDDQAQEVIENLRVPPRAIEPICELVRRCAGDLSLNGFARLFSALEAGSTTSGAVEPGDAPTTPNLPSPTSPKTARKNLRRHRTGVFDNPKAHSSGLTDDARNGALICAQRLRAALAGRFRSAQDAFALLSGGESHVSLEDWTARVAGENIVDRTTAMAAFGYIVAWRHSRWDITHPSEEDACVTLASFTQALGVTPPGSLPQLLARLLERHGSLPSAFKTAASLGGSEELTPEGWVRFCLEFSVNAAEASRFYAMFKPSGPEGTVSQAAFKEAMSNAEPLQKIFSMVWRFMRRYSSVSKVFEGEIGMNVLLSKSSFEARCGSIGIGASEARPLFTHIANEGQASLADLLDELTVLEARALMHEPPAPLVPNAASDGARVGVKRKSGGSEQGEDSTRLPKLNLDLSKWRRQASERLAAQQLEAGKTEGVRLPQLGGERLSGFVTMASQAPEVHEAVKLPMIRQEHGGSIPDAPAPTLRNAVRNVLAQQRTRIKRGGMAHRMTTVGTDSANLGVEAQDSLQLRASAHFTSPISLPEPVLLE
eukprot:gnl/MRDRNA2_/MRDRNA2_80616_c0_seq1.p1 gnl/MRDRNA2_/MRDRNA2_80616_c0~~gnl/MRDRNA2_/MRDRNA2_80616_c0_seq1.p1  ORF type:complete len:3466 (-),score=747.90 gnl/MRDRNA2_/MRDRNA2_80616_c0_seq1:129-9998(-)